MTLYERLEMAKAELGAAMRANDLSRADRAYRLLEQAMEQARRLERDNAQRREAYDGMAASNAKHVAKFGAARARALYAEGKLT